MTFRFPTPDQITSQLIATFKRFPLAVISAFITMVLIVYLIEQESASYANFEVLIKTAFVASLGLFMFTALRLLGEKNPLCLLGIVALVGYYFSLPDMKDPSAIVMMRHFFLNVAFFIMILWSAYWKSAPSNEQYWEWNQRVIFGFLTAIIFGIVLYAGLSGALFAVNELFSLEIDGKRYGQLLFLVIGLFGVNYFLSQIPEDTHTLKIHTYTKVENIFTRYILTPMAIGYFLILYTYTFKILITQEWPKGILAWIIIAFSVVALVTYLFWTPLWSQRAKKYKRFLFVILFLQTIMLGIAINMRISAYAWTENRYMVVALGIWLFGISLYFLMAKEARYKWIFLVLTVIIMISQVGPFSAYEVGKSSQQKRLKTFLNANPTLSEKSDIQTRYEVSSMVEYLAQNHSIESLKPVIPAVVSRFEEQNETQGYYGFVNFATKELGFEFVSRWDMKAQKEGKVPFSLYRSQLEALDVLGYDWVVETYYEKERKSVKQVSISHTIPKLDTRFTLTAESLQIEEHNITIAEISLKDFYINIMADEVLKSSRYRHDMDISQHEKLNFKYEDKNVSVKLLLLDMYTDINGSLENAHVKVLYKRF